MQDNRADLACIERILKGDQAAYRQMIDRHKTYAFSIALRILKNKEDAEEAAQDSFMKAFRSLDTFNKTSRFTTWFYRIVFNTAVSKTRKKQLNAESIDYNTGANVGYAEKDSGFKKEEQKYYINKAMEQLSAEDSTVLTLFYLQEFSLEEMSEITGVEENTLKVKLHRARKRMSQELSKILKDEVRELW